MALTYIYHSCFALSEEAFLIVYDFWQDPHGRLNKLLEESIQQEKEVYFVISHFHQDHYNPNIPQWCQEHNKWHLLPSYDTVRRRLGKSHTQPILRFGDVVETPYFALHVYHSTDVHPQWDGTDLNGNPCPMGAYVYHYSFTEATEPDRLHQEQGTLTLLR